MNKTQSFSSLHTHTTFCDGKDDIETMCRAAFEKKLCAIGLSAHAPITKKTGIESDWNLKDDKFEEYVEQVLAAKKRWQGKLEVLLGFEVDYIKGLRSALDSDITAVNPDYLIGSVHYLIPSNGAKPFTVDGHSEEFLQGLNEGFGGDAQALMHSYYDALAEMIALGGFEILGHADLIKKNSHGKNYWPEESELCRQKEIAHTTGEAGIIAEVNTGGINRKKINETYPSVTFLRFFRENNVPVIITADAHRAEHIDGNYDFAVQTLLSAGFSDHIIIFRKSDKKIICEKENLHN
ncbi:MAG: histidinol-phosphatase [Treponema sp.]|jgi:histidinol-phosphatase (PHP family)|nr:histidinol-phosphatase [Treponema sp.]